MFDRSEVVHINIKHFGPRVVDNTVRHCPLCMVVKASILLGEMYCLCIVSNISISLYVRFMQTFND